MAGKVAVAFVHGIRTGGSGYSQTLERSVRRRLGALQTQVDFREVTWSDLVRERQRAYVEALKGKGLNPRMALREFLIQGLGDATAYTKQGSTRSGIYYDIQGRLREKLAQLDSAQDPQRPLVLVCHSLGCHIVSSFLWDMRKLRLLTAEQRAEPKYRDYHQEFAYLDGHTPLARLETLAGLITFGNNMPLFAFTYPGADIYTVNCPHQGMPAAFPGSKVQGATLVAAKWINIYSRRDPLGYPLEPLTPNYADDPRVTDKPHPVEGLISLPLLGMIDAHTRYWGSGFVAAETASLLKDLINSR